MPPLELIRNLANAAAWHKAACHEPCGVSLFALRLAAEELIKLIPAGTHDHDEARALIGGMAL